MTAVAGIAVAALSMAAGCSDRKSDAVTDELAVVSSGTTCDVGKVCPLVVPIPPFGVPIAASVSQSATLAPKASIAAGAALVNTGTGETTLAPEAHAGAIWTRGNVTVAARARVDGPLVVGGTLTKGPEAVAPAPTAPNGTPGKATINVTFPATMAKDITVAGGKGQTLAPGRYGAVSVGAKGTLSLSTGVYYLESLSVGTAAIVSVDNRAGSTGLFVRKGLTSAGQLVSLGKPADILIGAFGTGQVTFTANLAATIVAPAAEVVLGASVSLSGAVGARALTMSPSSTLTRVGLGLTGPLASAVTPVLTPSGDHVLPPKPQPVGQTPQQYLQAIDQYLDKVVADGFDGNTLDFPAHPDLKGNEPMPALDLPGAAQSPSPPQGSVEGSVATGVSNVVANIPEADITKPLPPPVKPKPKVCPLVDPKLGGVFPSEIHIPLNAGDPPKSGTLFDAFWFADGSLDASASGTLFQASGDPSFTVGGVVFGQQIDVLFAQASASGTLGLQGDQARSAFSADAHAKLGPFETPHFTLGGSSERTLQADMCGTFCDHPQSLLPVPITVPMGPVVLSVQGFLEAHVPLVVQADESGPELTISPVIRAYVDASLSIPFIPTPSIEGQLDLIRLDAPVQARLRWEVNQSPEVCAVRLLADSKYDVKLSSLNGRIFLVLKLIIPLLFETIEIDLARIEVVSFDGISFDTGWKNLFSAQVLPQIPLGANACLLGGMSCTEGAPDRVFDPPPDPSVPGQGDTSADYGRDSCPGQYVWDLPTDFIEHLMGFSITTTPGDIPASEAPCDQRKGAVTMWKHVNGVWSEITRYRLVGGTDATGACIVTAVNRSAENPLMPGFDATSFVNTRPDSDPWQRIPFEPGMDKIRVAMAAAVGDCTPLKLSFSPGRYQAF